MQAASDIFLGWTTIDERHYYVRQLRDMKGSIPVEKLAASGSSSSTRARAAPRFARASRS